MGIYKGYNHDIVGMQLNKLVWKHVCNHIIVLGYPLFRQTYFENLSAVYVCNHPEILLVEVPHRRTQFFG